MTPAPSSSLAFWSILLPLATLIAPMSAAAPGPAPPPVGTFAHTAVIVNNTVFIQGGSMANNLASTASYAIILDSNKSLKNATWLDTSKLSAFTPRSYAAAAPTDNGILICGGTTDNEAMSVDMDCDIFNAMWYNKTTIKPPTGTLNRAGMGVAYQKTSDGTKIFFIGGSLNPAKQIASTSVNIASIPSSSSTVMWTAGRDLPVRGIAFHTTTWMGSPANSIVLFGGDMILYPSVALYNPADGSWTPSNLTMTISDLVRRGHSAVDGGNGKIYIYGGLDLQLKVRNDMMVIDTTQPQPWPLRMLAKGPEGRAFHTATRLPDNTILILWGSSAAGTDAKSTYMVYDIGQDVWTTKTPQLFPPMKEILESPNTPAINNPGSTPVPGPPSPGPPSPESPRSEPSTPGLPLIVGISVGGAVLVILISVLLFYVCRSIKRRNRAPVSDSLSESEEGKPKLAKTHTTQPSPCHVRTASNHTARKELCHVHTASDLTKPREPYYTPYAKDLIEPSIPCHTLQGLPRYSADRRDGRKVVDPHELQYGTDPHDLRYPHEPRYSGYPHESQYRGNQRGPQHKADHSMFECDTGARAPQGEDGPAPRYGVDHRAPQSGTNPSSPYFSQTPRAPQNVKATAGVY